MRILIIFLLLTANAYGQSDKEIMDDFHQKVEKLRLPPPVNSSEQQQKKNIYTHYNKKTGVLTDNNGGYCWEDAYSIQCTGR